MGAPRVDQVNIVVEDAALAAAFLTELGVEVPDTVTDWQSHHRNVPSATSVHGGHGPTVPSFDIDLDSSVFAELWGGLPEGFNGVVMNIRVDERDEVDRLHEQARSLGGRSLKEPYDAFWGSRFAVVEAPGKLMVGLMSVPEAAHRKPTPDPATFA